jgi:hypothetical protein
LGVTFNNFFWPSTRASVNMVIYFPVPYREVEILIR